MMLPGFGIISEIIAVKARKPIFGYRMMAFSLLAIVVLGFTVWAHHMFVSGMSPWIRIPMMITTAIIAIPTGIKIFSWLATLWRGVLHLDTPMLFALGFLTMFTLGGISGVMLAMIPFDIHVSQTYFIVAHIHYVLFGGSLFTIFAGVYYWFPKMTGRMFDDRLGKFHFWMTFIFFNLTFGPMHIIGIQGMPRRVAEYAAKFADWNLFISLCSFALGAATLIFIDLRGASGVVFILPLLMFLFLLALGEDYNILVMTRIREEVHDLPLRAAVTRALNQTGTTVTSAGLVLAGTFAVFAIVGGRGSGGGGAIDIGTGVAIGILMDTFLVRTLLVPSAVVLLGRWNWWPSRLGRSRPASGPDTAPLSTSVPAAMPDPD
jgi:hypothetical protein